MMSSALIFGINSPVAALLGKTLLAQDFSVYGIYHRNINSVPAGIPTFTINELEQFDKPVTYLFIVGAYIPRGRYNEPSTQFVTANIDAVSILCHKFPDARVIFCSSVAVFGSCPGVICEESHYMNPSLYGLSKLAGETIVRQSGSYAICRFTSIYGAGIEPNNFINRCIMQARTQQEITLFGDGSREQNYLFINDAIGWLLAAAQSTENGTFLCTSTDSVSNSEIAQFIARALNVPVTYSGNDESSSAYFNNDFSRQLLNFNSKMDIFQGIDACLGA